MALRVTKSEKDRDGDLTGLCGTSWSHTKIHANTNSRTDWSYYYVQGSSGKVNVRIGTRRGQEYLTTARDDPSAKNLTDC